MKNLDLENLNQAEQPLPEEEEKSSPAKILFGAFIILIFILSIFPIYVFKVNPPPDKNAIEDFKLDEKEIGKLGEIKFTTTSSISEAIKQIDTADYRDISVRLATASCKEYSDLCYAKAIYLFLQAKTLYVSDPKVQYVQSPAETLISSGGDCEDKSILLAAMLESIGIDADIGLTSNHAFVRAQLPDAPFWIKNKEGYVWLDLSSQSTPFGQTDFPAEEVEAFLESS